MKWRKERAEHVKTPKSSKAIAQAPRDYLSDLKHPGTSEHHFVPSHPRSSVCEMPLRLAFPTCSVGVLQVDDHCGDGRVAANVGEKRFHRMVEHNGTSSETRADASDGRVDVAVETSLGEERQHRSNTRRAARHSLGE